MSDHERGNRLRLPGTVAWTVLQVAAALAGSSCGDDDAMTDSGPPPVDMAASDLGERDAAERDARTEDARIADATMDAADALTRDGAIADAEPDLGFPDFGPEEFFCIFDSSIDSGMDFDAATCGSVVFDPDDCPAGCRAVG